MLTVRDLMSRSVATVDPDLSLREAVELFTTKHVTGAPVTAGGRIVGVLSASDVLGFQATTPGVPAERPELELEEWAEPTEWVEGEEPPGAFFSEWWSHAGADVLERFAQAGSAEWDQLAEHTVSEAMTQGICSVSPDADIYRAAAYMVHSGVHRLLVIEAGKLVGILTSMDIVRAVAQRRLAATRPDRRATPRARADVRR